MTMTEALDLFAGGDAPLLGEGEVTIESAKFGYDTAYNADALGIIFTGTVKTDDGLEFPWEKIYSVGRGWEVADQGARIVRESGPMRQIQTSSKFGLWFTAAMKTDAVEVLRERGNAALGFTEAKVWEGLKFEVRGTSHNYGGEIGTKQVLVPVKFLGLASSPAATGSTAPARASSTAASGNISSTNGEVPKALHAKLKKLASEVPDHDTFIDQAFLIDGVDGNSHVESLVADSTDYYESLKAS